MLNLVILPAILETFFSSAIHFGVDPTDYGSEIQLNLQCTKKSDLKQ
jgi:hypothetical protein